MKIFIFLHQNPYYESSASANRWRTLIEGLSIYKEIQFVLFITGGYSNKIEKQELRVQGNYAGIDYQYLNTLSNDTIWQRRCNKYLLIPLFKKNVKKKAIHYLINETEGVVWTDSSLEGFELAVTLKKKKSKLKIFIEMSEFLDIHKFNKGNVLQRLKGNQRQKYFETKAIYAYDGMALMTDTLLNYYKQIKGPLPKLLHLPMTVDFERFENLISTEYSKSLPRPFVSYVGVMNNKKDGVDILIKAFDQVKQLVPDLKLHLFGPYNYDIPGHLQQIANAELADSVFYHGEVSRDNVPAILSEAALLVMPRPNSKQAQGGFPTKLGEYLATGKPVCATTVGEIPDYLTDNESVFFAQPGSVESFADAMKRALSDPENAKIVGMNGKQVAQKEFNKDIQAKKLHQFLLELQDEKND